MKRKRISVRKVSENNEKNLYDFDFQQAYDYFLSAKKSEGLRETTLISYDEHFRFFTNWLKEFHKDVQKISDVNSFLLREYMNYMREEHMNIKTKEAGLSPQTINARIRFLKNFYNLLFKEEIVEINPAESVRFLKIDETPFQPLTKEEMKRLFNIPDVKNYPQFRDYVLMNLLYDSGMRINEAINLVVSELEIKAKRIILPASKNKTRKIRIIPLSSHTVRLLMELINENQAHFESEYVFLNWYGEHLSEDTFRRNLKRYVEKAGITKRFSCHDFRRQFCTEFLAEGGSLFSLQSIVGHSQISTTRKYVRFDEQMIKNQHELYSPVVKLRQKFKRGR
ncbi:Tyrosine recombinase XerC [Bacillus rhizoplanae]|uniref:Tyrosine recombinase XerC n=1 Tax=Bacillus rhizoplanae TaxID=2880966 RepID=A0ABM8Y842_9BACI|nr:tyrosine-type recombinase/integrase [Bacillus rhizoplanae]CAG9611819.1 Tyrosine recombinase XerC [Bacillus rhizoplanae]